MSKRPQKFSDGCVGIIKSFRKELKSSLLFFIYPGRETLEKFQTTKIIFTLDDCAQMLLKI